MKAVRYHGKETLRLEEIPVPAVNSGEALIKVACSGICGSDIGIYAGVHPRAQAPLVMGHEFAGEIAALAAGYQGDLRSGDRVTVNPLLSCGQCTPCRTGNGHVCRWLRLTGIDEDGSFAEFVKVRTEQIIKLPAGVSLEQGAIVEPAAVAVHAVRRSGLRLGEFVLVVGGGPIGFLIAAAARFAGAGAVAVIEPNPFRRDMLARLRVTALAPADAGRVLDLTGGDGADVVFEAAGVAGAIESAVKYCRIRGRIVNAGVFKQPTPVNLQRINFAELAVAGSRVYSPEAFRAALALVAAQPDLAGVITHKLPLAEAESGINLMRTGGDSLKILLRP
ncbi:MAG: alcohol dehydrogenase catalytic domain-containing protein [Sporomusaceae bacterium]|nr:alcohol dehydrogenase catalytic domain-containing protein [Sporomusaceae bacterium]